VGRCLRYAWRPCATVLTLDLTVRFHPRCPPLQPGQNASTRAAFDEALLAASVLDDVVRRVDPAVRRRQLPTEFIDTVTKLINLCGFI
jgi:hypothetical protein